MADAFDPYAILGVPSDAKYDVIKTNYRRLVLKHHPDKNREQDGSVKEHKINEFQNIQRAYDILGDADKRADHDAEIKLARLRKRKEFLAYVGDFFDKWEDADRAKENGIDATPITIPFQAEQTEEARLPMEEEIKERNRVFEKLKGRGRSRSTSRPGPRPSKKEILYAVPIEQLNLQTMNPQQNNALVDIVAVHGLGAIPNITWRERTSKIDWLRHETMLPSAVPDARILRFGYDSIWMGKTPIRTSLSTIAYKLLLSLSISRMEDLRRPLIFIGHCFGGLVIQRALNLAKMQHDAYPGVFDSFRGAVFLGTPHRGTKSFAQDSALFAAIAASSDLSEGLETGILKYMKSEGGALLDVTDDFVNLCSGRGSLISCFFEQRSSKLGKIVGRKDIDEFIVDQQSATLDGHRRYGLELDHFSLNKFDGPNNPNFIQVRAEIQRFYSAALKKTKSSEGLSNDSSAKSSITHASSVSESGTSITTVHSGPLPHSAVNDKEQKIKMKATKELLEDEARRQKSLYDAELQRERLEQKRLAEALYIKRLKQNMVKYGIENPDEILSVYPLPDDQDLTKQEIKDKDRWYRNLIKGELLAAGVDGGQIDEILNDTGDTMAFDDVEMTFTTMAKRWISTRTLDRYEIPWEIDSEDKSAIIIKRWVPEYEREFLWDHSQALRDTRGRKPHRLYNKGSKPTNKQDLGKDFTQQEHWMRGMLDAFNDARSKGLTHQAATDAEIRSLERNRKETERQRRYAERKRFPSPDRVRRSEAKPNARHYYTSGADGRKIYVSQDDSTDYEGGRYSPRRSDPLARPAYGPSYRRTASTDSLHSAPNYHEVDRRRRNSRALSGSRERVPIARQSGEFSRWNSRAKSSSPGPYGGDTAKRAPPPRASPRDSTKETKKGKYVDYDLLYEVKRSAEAHASSVQSRHHESSKAPKTKPTSKADDFQERILRGDFYMC